MESSPSTWDLVKLAMEQANVVLEKVKKAMNDAIKDSDGKYSISQSTIENIEKAAEGISASLKEEDTLSKIAEDIEYSKLVEELSSLEMPMGTKEYLIAQKFKGIN